MIEIIILLLVALLPVGIMFWVILGDKNEQTSRKRAR
jgi:hypothetical protein